MIGFLKGAELIELKAEDTFSISCPWIVSEGTKFHQLLLHALLSTSNIFPSFFFAFSGKLLFILQDLSSILPSTHSLIHRSISRLPGVMLGFEQWTQSLPL